MLTASTHPTPRQRYGMVVDLDRCTGCGACTIACAVENNVPPPAERATERTGVVWLRVDEVEDQRPGGGRSVFVPMPCQQCDAPPCEAVCPQRAVEKDPETGVVGQIPDRCLGCLYCMAACAYHARSFNWFSPRWPEGLEATLNPDVSLRNRGVVEKCNFCFHRLQAAREKAAVAGRKEIDPKDYVPACVEACPTRAIVFGDLADPASEVARAAAAEGSFRLMPQLGCEPKVFYRSAQPWVRSRLTAAEVARG